MKTFIFAVILALTGASPAAAQTIDLPTLIDRVDRNFAGMRDFSADFIQITAINLNRTQQDEGHLYLTKDHKMRAEYQKPEQRLYVSDGKTLFSYSPLDREVIQEKLKDSAADLTPMMALIGRAGLAKEFDPISELNTKPLFGGDRVLRLKPVRKNENVQSIEIEVNPRSNQVDRIIVLGADKSRNEFIFMNIETNKSIPVAKFQFIPPAGTRQVIQGGTK